MPNVFDKVKTTLNTALDTISAAKQSVVENSRNKTKAKNLKKVMRSEVGQLNRAYIALGKEYFDLLRKGENVPTDEKQENLLKDINSSRDKLSSALKSYRTITEKPRKAAKATRSNEETGVSSENKEVPVRKTVKSAAEIAQKRAEIIAKNAKRKSEAVAETAEVKPIITSEPLGEKPKTVAELAKEKPKRTAKTTKGKSEKKVEELSGKAAVVAGITAGKAKNAAKATKGKTDKKVEELSDKAAAVGIAAGKAKNNAKATKGKTDKKVEELSEKASAVAGIAGGKVKEVGEDPEKLKHENYRMREALKSINNKMKVLEEVRDRLDSKVEANEKAVADATGEASDK